MGIFKKIFDFYIYSSIHVGLAVFALVCITQISLTIPIAENMKETIFFGTVLGYNFLKYIAVFNLKMLKSKRYIAIAIVSLTAILGGFYFFMQLNVALQIEFIKIGILVLIYPLLRKYGLIKMFFVSFCVALITVYLPSFLLKSLSLDFFILFLQRFLIVISMLIPFEILDSKTDHLLMNTIPQQFGINAAKLFGILLVIPFMVIEFLKTNPNYLVLPIGILITLLIDFSSLKRGKYYTSFWVESVPILWWILLMIFQ